MRPFLSALPLMIATLAAPAWADDGVAAMDDDRDMPLLSLTTAPDEDGEDDAPFRYPDAGRWTGDHGGDPVRWRVKVRPNRAMGRVSLSF